MPTPNIHARLKLLATEEGGRQTPFIAGYRSQFHFDGEVEGWVMEIVHCEPNPFPPGTEGIVVLNFLSWERLKYRLTIGTRFQIKEGYRVLGEGEVFDRAPDPISDSPRDFIAKYSVSANRLRIEIDGKPILKALYAEILSPERDSFQNRQRILQQVAERIGRPILNLKAITIELNGVVRADLCDFKESFSLTDPLPAARAKVVVRLPCPSGDLAAFDRCAALEERLEAALDGSGIGFVDGNDCGQGEFCIYCYGPRKSDLRERIRAFLDGENFPETKLW